MTTAASVEYGPGTQVEVRTRYLSSWAPGFEVVRMEGDRVGIRRRSDGVTLPVTVAVADVRPAPRAVPPGPSR